MKIKIKKKDPSVKTPVYSSNGAACFDIFSNEDMVITPLTQKVFKTGLYFEIPEGYVMLIYGRSGLATKNGVSPTNCVAVIDSDYRGEVHCALYNHFFHGYHIRKGDRICQAMVVPYPKIEFEEVDNLSETLRGAGGIGSTGS